MKPCVFTGSAVAIVTPFCGESVDLEAFDRLIERQIQGGTDAIVVCGTTGEAATLSYDERMALIERCVRTVDRRVPVIAGSGTNSTASSIALSKAAQSAGVDALLTVTVYTDTQDFSASFYQEQGDDKYAYVVAGADNERFLKTDAWRVGTLLLTCEGTRIFDASGQETPVD